MVYNDPFQVQPNYQYEDDCFLFNPINPAPISKSSQPNKIYQIEKKSSLTNNIEETETDNEEELETETEYEEEDKSPDESNLTHHDIILEKRRLDYQDNKAHIKNLRQTSRFDCPCGSEVMSCKRAQHLRSNRHQLFVFKNQDIAIPTKPTNK